MVANDIVINLRVIDEASGQMKRVGQNMSQFSKEIKLSGLSANQVGKEFRNMNLKINDTGEAVNQLTGQTMSVGKAMADAQKNTRRFKMEFLGVMFFGMQLMRTFKGLTVGTTKFFMKVTEGQTDAGRSVTKLSASYEFLKFSLGNAIGEMVKSMPFLMDMLNAVSGWIENNQKLAAGITLGLLVTGTGLFAFAQLGLATQALDKMFPAVAGAIKGGFAGIFGKGLVIGVSIFFALEMFETLQEGLDLEDWKKIVISFLGLAGVGALLGLTFLGGLGGAAIGATIGISVGAIITFNYEFKEEGISEAESFIKTMGPSILAGDVPGAGGPTLLGIGPFGLKISDFEGFFGSILTAAKDVFTPLTGIINEVGFMIASPRKGSFPLVYSLMEAEKEWVTMSDLAQVETQEIIDKLDTIPREIVTIHRVITVYESGRSSAF